MRFLCAVALAGLLMLSPAVRAQTALPEGVDRLFANQGDNTITAYATPEGFAELWSLVRHLDGQLAVLRVEASLAEMAPADARAMSITATGSAFSPAQTVRLRDMARSGRLRVLDGVRVTEREDTSVDTLLGTKTMGTVALSLIPRLNDNGTVSVELSAPLSGYFTAASGETVFVPISAAPDGSGRLLAITPVLVAH